MIIKVNTKIDGGIIASSDFEGESESVNSTRESNSINNSNLRGTKTKGISNEGSEPFNVKHETVSHLIDY